MILLDTDHLTIIQRQSEPAYSILQRRLLGGESKGFGYFVR